jgi:hypothetical protein
MKDYTHQEILDRAKNRILLDLCSDCIVESEANNYLDESRKLVEGIDNAGLIDVARFEAVKEYLNIIRK